MPKFFMDKREEIKLERIKNEEFQERKIMLILVRIIKKLTFKKIVMIYYNAY